MGLDDFEETTHQNVTARRNHLMALWAGKQLGLTGNELQGYAADLHAADHEEAGASDVIRKIITDLANADIHIGSESVWQTLTQSEAIARRELLSTACYIRTPL